MLMLISGAWLRVPGEVWWKKQHHAIDRSTVEFQSGSLREWRVFPPPEHSEGLLSFLSHQTHWASGVFRGHNVPLYCGPVTAQHKLLNRVTFISILSAQTANLNQYSIKNIEQLLAAAYSAGNIDQIPRLKIIKWKVCVVDGAEWMVRGSQSPWTPDLYL